MPTLKCKRCDREIVENATLALDVFEGMHWLCFHLEYEHDADPDISCGAPSCPWFEIGVLRSSLEERGANPDEVLRAAIERLYAGGSSTRGG